MMMPEMTRVAALNSALLINAVPFKRRLHLRVVNIVPTSRSPLWTHRSVNAQGVVCVARISMGTILIEFCDSEYKCSAMCL